MVSMSSYPSLLMALALFSHGFLLSLSKSIRKAEGDEMLLDSISLGKALRSGEGAEKAMVNQLEHFKNDESSFLDEEEERSAKNLALKHNFLGHSGLNFAMRQFPYLALRGPSDSETQSLESVQERREAGEEDSAAKLPIGRRDFDRCSSPWALQTPAGHSHSCSSTPLPLHQASHCIQSDCPNSR